MWLSVTHLLVLGLMANVMMGALFQMLPVVIGAPMARACLLLRAVQDLDYSELSRLLGIPEGTAMSHVHRARNALRRALADRGTEGERR